MVGTITHSIGSAGRDFSNIGNWLASLPSNLVTDGNCYVGLLYNDSEFLGNGLGGTSTIAITGHTTDASHTITLTAAPGQSFADSSSNALTYNIANGVGVKNGDNYYSIMTITDLNVTISRIQFRNTNSAYYSIGFTNSPGSVNIVIDKCIIKTTGNAGGVSGVYDNTGTVKNSVMIVEGNNNGIWGGFHNFNMVNCIVVSPTSGAYSGTNYSYNSTGGYGGGGTIISTAFFGFSSTFMNSGGSPGSFINCYTDATTSLASGVTGGITYANCFVNTTYQSTLQNFKLKAGSPLLDVGTTNTTSLGYATDIFGTARPQGTAWDVGAFELVASVGGTTTSVTATVIRARSASGSFVEPNRVSASAIRTRSASGTLVEPNTVSATIARTRAAFGALTELNQVTATVTRNRLACGSLVEPNNVTANVTRTRLASGSLTSVATTVAITAAVTRTRSASGSLVEPNKVSASATRTRLASGNLVTQITSVAVTAAAIRTRIASGSFVEPNTVSASITRTRSASGNLSSTVTNIVITAAAIRIRSASGSLVEPNKVSASVTRTRSASGNLSSTPASGAVTAAAIRTRIASGSFVEPNTVSASITRTRLASGNLSASATPIAVTAAVTRSRSAKGSFVEWSTVTAAAIRTRSASGYVWMLASNPPQARWFSIYPDSRSFTMSADNRSFTVNSDTRTFSITPTSRNF